MFFPVLRIHLGDMGKSLSGGGREILLIPKGSQNSSENFIREGSAVCR
jgi:hypothetical protein